MRGRFVIVGLTALAVLAIGAGTAAVPTQATAEFRVPGLFGGKKAVKRKRYRHAAPIQPVRNPDRVFASVSAEVTSPDIAKNSLASLSVGTASAASVRLALPAPASGADRTGDSGEANAESETAAQAAPTSKGEKKGAEASTKDTADTDEAVLEAEDIEVAVASEATEAKLRGQIAIDSDPTNPSAPVNDRAVGPEKNADNKASSETAGSKTSDGQDADRRTADQKTADQEEIPGDKAEDELTVDPSPTEKRLSSTADSARENELKTASADGQEQPEEDVKETSEAGLKAAAAATVAALATESGSQTATAPDKEATKISGPDADASTKAADRPAVESEADGLKEDATKDAVTGDGTPESANTKSAAEKAEEPRTIIEAADAAASAAQGSDAKVAEGEIVTAAPPPVPDQKPAIESMKSPVNTPERLADGAADSERAPTDADARGNDPAVSDPRGHKAAVILDISPPPSTKAEGDDAKTASLAPDMVQAADSGSAGAGVKDRAADKDSPPSTSAKAEGDGIKTAAPSPDVPSRGEATPSTNRNSSGDGADNVLVDLGPPPPVDPVIAAIRSKLEGKSAPKVATADMEALKTLYGERDEDPLWVVGDGLTKSAKLLIATIGDADDWGLVADAYVMPAPDKVLTTDEARADAEVSLSAAVLKYARHAQTGRLIPSRAHKLFDFHPKARDPKSVLVELAESKTPDKALLALHPQNKQYQGLHAALIQARDSAKSSGRNPDNDRTVQLIVINMERWRWLPSDLGAFHVWNNIPEFNFRVVKDGRQVYEAITIVGQTEYATAFFSAPMRNIVFNPNWTVPPTIVKEDIAPKLKGPQRSAGLFGGRESRNRMLRRYGLTVSKGGKPVDADQVDWQAVNVHAYTFQQDPGPHNVLGQFKFNFPNKHAIYMHDTTQKELFGRQVRTLSHGCIRVNQPTRFAAFLLAEDKGWSMDNVQDVFARAQGQTKVIALKRRIPVHLTYNTLVADSFGSIREFSDVYGIDNQMAAKLFKNPAYFSAPYAGAEFAETTPNRLYSEPRRRRSPGSVDDFLSGLLGN